MYYPGFSNASRPFISVVPHLDEIAHLFSTVIRSVFDDVQAVLGSSVDLDNTMPGIRRVRRNNEEACFIFIENEFIECRTLWEISGTWCDTTRLRRKRRCRVGSRC